MDVTQHQMTCCCEGEGDCLIFNDELLTDYQVISGTWNQSGLPGYSGMKTADTGALVVSVSDLKPASAFGFAFTTKPDWIADPTVRNNATRVRALAYYLDSDNYLFAEREGTYDSTYRFGYRQGGTDTVLKTQTTSFVAKINGNRSNPQHDGRICFDVATNVYQAYIGNSLTYFGETYNDRYFSADVGPLNLGTKTGFLAPFVDVGSDVEVLLSGATFSAATKLPLYNFSECMYCDQRPCQIGTTPHDLTFSVSGVGAEMDGVHTLEFHEVWTGASPGQWRKVTHWPSTNKKRLEIFALLYHFPDRSFYWQVTASTYSALFGQLLNSQTWQSNAIADGQCMTIPTLTGPGTASLLPTQT